MIDVTKSIPNAFFANSPAIVKGTSDCVSIQNSSMHSVICKITIGIPEGTYSEELIYPLDPSGENAEFMFNLSNACQNALEIRNKYELPNSTPWVVGVKYELRERYLYDKETVLSDIQYKSARSFAYPGGLTSIERMSHSEYEDIANITPAALTRFPSNERRIAFIGTLFMVPVLGGVSGDDETNPGSPKNYGAIRPIFSRVGIIDVKMDPYVPGGILKFYSIQPSDEYRQICFINGFGIQEMVCVKCKESHVIDGDKKIYFTENIKGFEPTVSVKSYPGKYENYIKLATGVVSKAFAEWFMYEVCKSHKVWMYDLNIDEWIEGAITHDKTVTSIDKVKGAGCSIEFTFYPSIQGSRLAVFSFGNNDNNDNNDNNNKMAKASRSVEREQYEHVENVDYTFVTAEDRSL